MTSDAHAVPEEVRERTARTLAATPRLRGEPTDAERSRTLLAAGRTGALATVTAEPSRTPYASLVGYAVDDHGSPMLCLSDLAEHSRNLRTDNRCSLLVSAARAADPLAAERVTVLGTAVEQTADAREQALRYFRNAHPDAFYAAYGDFRLLRLEVGSARYVGGFGRMSWIEADELAAAEPDPLAAHLERIVEHMNDDHADALVLFCRSYADRVDTVAAQMVGVDRYGFDVLARDEPDAPATAVRFPFPQRSDTPEAVRAAMVAMVRAVRPR